MLSLLPLLLSYGTPHLSWFSVDFLLCSTLYIYGHTSSSICLHPALCLEQTSIQKITQEYEEKIILIRLDTITKDLPFRSLNRSSEII